MEYIFNNKENKKVEIKDFTKEIAEKVCDFHKTIPEYDTTPLVELKNLSKECGVKSIFIKDESKRFGLNSFKALGGTYAIGKEIQKKMNWKDNELTFSHLMEKDAHSVIKNYTFISATDGNHGRGVAWTSQRLGAKGMIYMPKGSAKERIDNILATGAECFITDLNYDDTVRVATQKAQENGWTLVQDTAFGEYRDIPLHIMQGYMTLALESYKQLNGVIPTHIFVQAGVGSLAGSITAFFKNVYGENMPKIIVVEPNNAACIYKTASYDDGELHFVKGDLETIMAGLSCGEPCSIGYEILNCYADCFIKMEDEIAAKAMKTLAFPLGDDEKVISGESGCAGFGAAMEIINNNKELKEKLGINENSVMLFINTEGDTDKENYNKIVFGK